MKNKLKLVSSYYYPPSKALIEAVNLINEGKVNMNCFYFDHPDYAGLPEKISSELWPDEVDWIQEHWEEIVKNEDKKC